MLTDIHTETIRTLQFTPTHLHSAADDGLIHIYDNNNLSEDALSGVINVGNGINRMGLIGNFIWSITHTHECQIWSRESVSFIMIVLTKYSPTRVFASGLYHL